MNSPPLAVVRSRPPRIVGLEVRRVRPANLPSGVPSVLGATLEMAVQTNWWVPKTMNLRFLADGSRGALITAVIMLALSMVVLLLPPSWGIMGGQAGIVVSLGWGLVAARRYHFERSQSPSASRPPRSEP